MGMFDDFTFDASLSGEFHCPKGHPVSDMQTKDFDCLLDKIHLGADRRLMRTRSTWALGDAEHEPSASPMDDTCYADVYSPCPTCDTWAEWRLHVRSGEVLEIKPIRERLLNE